jgi:tocopherol cyclase
VEVGGGPWWSAWSAEAKMAPFVRDLLNLPVDLEAAADFIPRPLRPPGL